MTLRKHLIILSGIGLAALLGVTSMFYDEWHSARVKTELAREHAWLARVPRSEFILDQSILTRAVGIERPSALMSLLDSMPPGLLPRDANSRKLRAAVWSLFFRGSMTKLARVPSRRPFIVFYNPIADVAVIEGCVVDPKTNRTSCQRACAIPGEILTKSPASSRPSWLLSRNPITALQAFAGARMRAIGLANPVASQKTVQWQRIFCSEKNQRSSEKRLISLAMSSRKFDARKFREAAGHYIAHAIRNASEPQLAGSKDDIVSVLAHLNELKMSAAIPVPQGGWLVFLTQKRSGWHMAVLGASSDGAGKMIIASARLLSISTKER
jgi:hypothetical protein